MGDAHRGAESLFLENIVQHASPEMINVMRDKFDPTRIHYLRHAEELVHFAQSIELVRLAVGLEFVAAHINKKMKGTGTWFLRERRTRSR